MEENKVKLYQKWWFWGCIVLIVCVIGLVVVLSDSKPTSTTGSTKTTYFDTSTNNKNNNETDEEKLKQNIKIEYAGTTKAGDFVIKVTNNNNVPVHIGEITTIYKDSNDTFMKKETSDDQYFGIEANSETYVHNWGYQENFEQYPKYEFDFSFSGSWNFKDSVIGNYEIKANNTGKQIAVEIKNNNNVSIEDVKVGVVFYKGDNIIGYVNGFDFDNTTSAGKSTYINVEYPEDNNYKKVNFDSYKVYILNAEKAN